MSRILIAGASGKVGARLASLLRDEAHDVVSASRASGIDTVTGAGLDDAARGARVIVDVTNVSSRDPDEVRRFFEASTDNLTAAARRNGVAHHIVLSVVGADEMPDSPYMRGKVAQERRVRAGGVPFTILRATQFFEFVATFPDLFAAGGEVRVPAGRMQPIAIDDVAAALAGLAVERPANGIVDLAGPRAMAIQDAVGAVARRREDHRTVSASRDVRYFGARLADDTLIPRGAARLGTLDLEQWLQGAASTEP